MGYRALTDEQFKQLADASALIGEILGDSVEAGEAGQDAIAMDLHVDSENDQEAVYEVTMHHDIASLEVVGVQLIFGSRDLEIIDKIVPRESPFPILLSTEPVSEPELALSPRQGGPGVTAGQYTVCRIKCRKTGDAPKLWWDKEATPPSRFTTRQSTSPPTVWIP